MTGRQRPQATHGPDASAETPEYLAEWAEALVKTADKAEARIALAHYQAIASNTRLAESDRDAARRRVAALQKKM